MSIDWQPSLESNIKHDINDIYLYCIWQTSLSIASVFKAFFFEFYKCKFN